MEKYICIYFKFFHPNNIFRSNTCAATRSMEWWCWVCIQGNDPNPLPCTCSRYSGIFSYVQLIPLWFHIGRVNYASKQYSHRPNLIEEVKVLLDHPHPHPHPQPYRLWDWNLSWFLIHFMKMSSHYNHVYIRHKNFLQKKKDSKTIQESI